MSKKCSKCGEQKQESEFHKDNHPRSKTKLQSHCKVCSKLGSKEWVSKNPVRAKENSWAWHYRNPGKANILRSEWRKKNKEHEKEYGVMYRKNNKQKVNAIAAFRYAKKVTATPIWADLEEIENIYLEAQYQQLQVDHMIPLVSDKVCGLHVENNLQLLSEKENKEKRNKLLEFNW